MTLKEVINTFLESLDLLIYEYMSVGEKFSGTFFLIAGEFFYFGPSSPEKNHENQHHC